MTADKKLKEIPLLTFSDAKKVQCKYKNEDSCRFNALYHGKHCTMFQKN
jgi:hypothetical protein